MTTEETIIRSVELLRPEPGDVVLLTVPDNTREEQRRNIARGFSNACGPNVKVAVLKASTSVKILRAEDVPPSAIAGPGFESQAPPPDLNMGTQLVP